MSPNFLSEKDFDSFTRIPNDLVILFKNKIKIVYLEKCLN